MVNKEKYGYLESKGRDQWTITSSGENKIIEKLEEKVVSQFDFLSNKPAISSSPQTWPETPASIAGVTFRALWTRPKL